MERSNSGGFSQESSGGWRSSARLAAPILPCSHLLLALPGMSYSTLAESTRGHLSLAGKPPTLGSGVCIHPSPSSDLHYHPIMQAFHFTDETETERFQGASSSTRLLARNKLVRKLRQEPRPPAAYFSVLPLSFRGAQCKSGCPFWVILGMPSDRGGRGFTFLGPF